MRRQRHSKSFAERAYLLFDRMSVLQVFLFWVIVIVLFGLSYMLISHAHGSLTYARDGVTVTSLLDSAYFSFITATSTGFGDIVPTGANKLISLLEVVIGMTIFAMLTSKLVGMKQERILREVYAISFQERIHRIRSSLYLYRADVGKIIMRLEEDGLRKRELADLWTLGNFFEQRVLEVVELFSQRRRNSFTNDIDVIDTKLLANSLVQSLSRTLELLEELERHGADWRREVTVFAFSEATKAATHCLETMRHESDGAALKQDMDIFEKASATIRGILKAHD